MRGALLSLALCTATWASRAEPSAADYAFVAARSVSIVSRGDPDVVFVLPQTLSQAARASIAELRHVVSRPEDVPAPRMPHSTRSYFVVDKFTIGSTEAVFEGQQGPGPCGAHYSIPFKLTGGQWEQGVPVIAVC